MPIFLQLSLLLQGKKIQWVNWQNSYCAFEEIFKIKFEQKFVKKTIFNNLKSQTQVENNIILPLKLKQFIRKGFLSRINQIYYWKLFCTTHEHYNYLKLKQTLIKRKLFTRDN